MINKRTLAPRFINRIDNWLLLNKPETWSIRTHLVAYYGGIFLLMLALLVYILPDDPKLSTNTPYWSVFTNIITLIAFVVWLIYLLRFNVFKRYGITSSLNSLKAFALYYLAACIIMLIPFVQPFVESIKANQAYPDKMLVKDMNDINTIINQLEHNNIDHVWHRDTLTVRNTLPRRTVITPDFNDGVPDTTFEVVKDKAGLVDTAELRDKLAYADSILQMNDSMYILLDCPAYIFLGIYNVKENTAEKLLSAKNMYYTIHKNFVQPDTRSITEKLQGLLKKYEYPYKLYEYYDSDTASIKIKKKYKIRSLDESISNIATRKYEWYNDLGDMSRIFLYFSLVITLLIFIFRHTTVKTFFLSLLAAVIISILTTLFGVLAGFNIEGVFIMMLVWFGIFTACTVMAWQSKTRSVWIGIGINMFVASVYFVPLVILGLYDVIRRKNQVNYEPLPPYLLNITEISCVVLLLVLIVTYIHPLYRRWYASPED